MSESEVRGGGRDLSARQILSLHEDHRKGLHDVPVPDCLQCTFDGLDHLDPVETAEGGSPGSVAIS
jgi:hypothetical protein